MRIKTLIAAVVLSVSGLTAAQAAPLLWNADSNGTLGTVDVETGNVNVIGNMGAVMTDIAFDQSGNLFGISFRQLYSINKTTGAATLIGEHNMVGGVKNSLVFDSAGNLFAASNALYSLNTSTGASTLIGSGGGYSSSGDLAFVDGELFLASAGDPDNLFKLDTATGVGTLVGSIGIQDVFGLASPDSSTLYGAAGTSIYGINTSTGAGSLLLDFSGQGLGTVFGTAFFSEAGATPVPVPGTLLLLVGGIGALGALKGRKKKS